VKRLSKNIKGITIEIDGETKGIEESLKDVNKTSRNLQSELKQVDSLLKFNPGNADLIAQRQKILGDQVDNTSETLKRLKDAQKDVQAAFEKGDLPEDKYRGFQREIIKTESKLNHFKDELKSVGDKSSLDKVDKDLQDVKKGADKAEDSVGELSDTLAGIGAGVGAATTIQQALDVSSLDTSIEISMEVPPESVAKVKNSIHTVEAYGVDANQSLEGVRRQWALNADATDEANQKVVQYAGVMTRAFPDLDFVELIQETNEISSELGITNDEALGLNNTLLKSGFPPDQIDIIAEYGQQLKRAGFSAGEIQGIMTAGVKTGTWNIDNLLDGLKNGRVKAAGMGQGLSKGFKSAISEVTNNTPGTVKQLEKWGDAIATGGENGSKAFRDMVEWLNNIEDKTLRNTIGTELFGSMWEDQGNNIIETVMNMNKHMGSVKANIDDLKTSTEAVNEDPLVRLQKAITDLKVALAPLLIIIADVVGDIATWMSKNPKLASTIVGVVSIIGILGGAIAGLSVVFSGIKTAISAVRIIFLAMAGPAGWIALAVIAIVAAVVVIYKNWGPISKFFKNLWEGVKSAFSVSLTFIKDLSSKIWTKISNATKGIWSGISKFFSTIWQFIKNIFSTVLNSIKKVLLGYWQSVRTSVTQIWEGILGYFRNVWKLIKNVFVGALLVILKIVTGQWSELGATISQIWTNIKDALAGIWTSIKQIFRGSLGFISGFMSQTWTNITNALRNAWTWIINFLKRTVTAIKNGIVSGFKKMYDGVVSAISRIIRAIRNIWGSIGDFFSEIDLYEIGVNMILGLINGIKSMGGQLVGSIKDGVGNLIESAEDLLDINSPSKVFEKIGVSTGEGLEQGLRSMGGRIQKASEKMTANTLVKPKTDFDLDDPKGKGKSGSSDGSGDSVGNNFTINFNGTVTSEDDIVRIARELERLISKRKRGKGVGL